MDGDWRFFHPTNRVEVVKELDYNQQLLSSSSRVGSAGDATGSSRQGPEPAGGPWGSRGSGCYRVGLAVVSDSKPGIPSASPLRGVFKVEATRRATNSTNKSIKITIYYLVKNPMSSWLR